MIGRTYDDAVRALAQFKVDRTETASDAPRGQVLAQEPTAMVPMLAGSTVSLRVSDGSLVTAKDTSTATAPAATTAVKPEPAVSTTPSATAAPAATTPSVPLQSSGRPPLIAFSADTVAGIGGGVLLGLFVGYLLMRRRPLGSARAPLAVVVPTTPDEQVRPVEAGGDVIETGAVPEMRFAARLYPGEITITLDPLIDSDQVALEGNQHA